MSQVPESNYRKPQRLVFSDDESKLPQLPILLDAYAIIDKGVSEAIKRFTDDAFDKILPFYDVKHKADRRKAIKQGSLHAAAKVMRDCHWQNLPAKMQDFDEKYG